MRIRERYELARELQERYAAAGRSERSEILNGFCLATQYERKHAIKVLRGRARKPVGPGRRRQRRYGLEFRQALRVCWEASGYLCSDRLQPFLPALLPLLQAHCQLAVAPATRALLLSASVATVERNLIDLRRGLVARKLSQTKPGALLRRKIPVVVGQWKALDQPGYLVSHSGEISAGRWIDTLCATDLSTEPTRLRVPQAGPPGPSRWHPLRDRQSGGRGTSEPTAAIFRKCRDHQAVCSLAAATIVLT